MVKEWPSWGHHSKAGFEKPSRKWKHMFFLPRTNLVTLQVIAISPPAIPSPKTRGLLNLDQNLYIVHLLNSLVAASVSCPLRSQKLATSSHQYTVKIGMEEKVNWTDSCFYESIHYFRAPKFHSMPCPDTKLRHLFVVTFWHALRASKFIIKHLPV